MTDLLRETCMLEKCCLRQGMETRQSFIDEQRLLGNITYDSNATNAIFTIIKKSKILINYLYMLHNFKQTNISTQVFNDPKERINDFVTF